jgi:hypothetical protein
MEGVATIRFKDVVSQDEAVAIVRAEPGHVGLALSRREDGDIEVFLTTEACAKLADALTKAQRLADPS